MSSTTSSVPRIAIEVYKDLVRWDLKGELNCCIRIRSVTKGLIDFSVISEGRVINNQVLKSEVLLFNKSMGLRYSIVGTEKTGAILYEDYSLGVARILGYTEGNFYSYKEQLSKYALGERFMLVGIDGTQTNNPKFYFSKAECIKARTGSEAKQFYYNKNASWLQRSDFNKVEVMGVGITSFNPLDMLMRVMKMKNKI